MFDGHFKVGFLFAENGFSGILSVLWCLLLFVFAKLLFGFGCVGFTKLPAG